ncbi:MAG: hypothetical protein SFZ03_07660 [Candidatus Melainabacteria bacterium]|nr:hypothetical protein [Candidatus Melainabacteria bacterium]
MSQSSAKAVLGDGVFLSYCDGATREALAGALLEKSYVVWPTPDQVEDRRLVLTQSPLEASIRSGSRCVSSVALNVAGGNRVLEMGLLSDAQQKAMAAGAIISVDQPDQPWKVQELSPLQEPVASSPEVASHPACSLPTPPSLLLPIQTNLLSRLRVKPFGQEERVRAHWQADSQHLIIDCSAGNALAGVLLQAPVGGRLPGRMHDALQSHIRVEQATGEFTWACSNTPERRESSPEVLGAVLPHTSLGLVGFSMPEGLRGGQPFDSWTVLCPTQAARLEISALSLSTAPAPDPASADRGAPEKARVAESMHSPRATWLWNPAQWRQALPAAFWEELHRLGIRRLYISVPVTVSETTAAQVNHPEALAAFIAQAHRSGVSVWVVEGDPHAILPEERVKFARRAAAYRAYNAKATAGQQLGGIQYDIEPYLLAGFSLRPEVWNQAYVETIQQLREASQMPLDVVLPFWQATARTSLGCLLLDALTPWVDGVTIMDYRTDPELIVRFAQPFLRWGQQMDRAVQIALEAGPLPDEHRRIYRPANQGELWFLRVGSQPVWVLLERPQPNPQGVSLAFSHATTASSHAVSFHGQKAQLLPMLPKLEQALAVSPSFAGLVLHEYVNGVDAFSP